MVYCRHVCLQWKREKAPQDGGTFSRYWAVAGIIVGIAKRIDTDGRKVIIC